MFTMFAYLKYKMKFLTADMAHRGRAGLGLARVQATVSAPMCWDLGPIEHVGRAWQGQMRAELRLMWWLLEGVLEPRGASSTQSCT